MRGLKILSLLLGAGLLFWILSNVDLSEVGELILRVGITGLGLIIFVYFLAFLSDSISWLLILSSLPLSLAG